MADQETWNPKFVDATTGVKVEARPNLLDLLLHLARQRKPILKVTFILMLLGALISFIMPKKFAATTELMPPHQSTSAAMIMMNQLAGSSASSLSALTSNALGSSPNDLYIGMLQSRPIADAIIQKFKLMQIFHAKDMTAARAKLANATGVKSDKDGLIDISVTDKDPVRAAQIANDYTEQLRQLTQTIGVSEASRRLLYYKTQLSIAKDSLVAAEDIFQQVQQKKGMIQLDAQAKALIEGMATLREQIAEKEVQVQTLRSYATENNPQLAIAERELLSLRGQAGSMTKSSSSPGSPDLSLQQVPSSGLEYLRAQRELQYRQALYDILLKQYEAAQLDESKDATVIQVVSSAIPPEHPTGLGHLTMIVLAAVLGFAIGCVRALLSWWSSSATSDPRKEEQRQELWKLLTTFRA